MEPSLNHPRLARLAFPQAERKVAGQAVFSVVLDQTRVGGLVLPSWRGRFSGLLWGLFLFSSWVSPLTVRAGNLDFARSLAGQQDCYRAVSEVKRVEFEQGTSAASLSIKLPCLAAQKDWRPFEVALPEFLADPQIPGPLKKRVLTTAFDHYIQSAQPQKAQDLSSQLPFPVTPFPNSETVENLEDPEKAAQLSAWLPGAGLWNAGRGTSALVSFGLNTSFVAGTWWALQNRAPTLGLLLMFFEVSWYQGGIKAAREAVVQNNQKKVVEAQRTWLLEFQKSF